MAFIHDIDGRLLVNAGTIGQPRDGDYRAQCMLIEDGAIRFERVDYDLEALRGDYAQSCLPDDIKETWFRYTQQGVVDVHGLQLGPFSAG
jgi:diadenosine tetraphosphatase ApaH/serine/threonine PP2A family protein phosphatase